MDVRLSAEQQALRDSVARAVDRFGPKAVADLDDAGRAARLETAIDASGWRELRTPGDDASGDRTGDARATPLASGVEAALVAEELACGLADAPFLGPTLAAELRRRAGAGPASAPETVLFLGDLSAPAALLDGSVPGACVAVDARHVPAAIALAPSPAGVLLATVPIGDRARRRVDLTRPSGFPAEARPEPVAGARPLGKDDLDAWTALGLALTCAELVGTMRGALRLAREYATVRRQYGRLIGSFQAVQHLLADAHVATEGARSIALHAAWATDALPPAEALAAAATAKAYCARAARAVCETSIQVHGGIGNTWECLAHVFLRRAILSTDILGGVGPSLQRVLAHQGIAHDVMGDSARGLR